MALLNAAGQCLCIARKVSDLIAYTRGVSIALYRRYRPEKFQEVIGQDHVVQPLMAALEAGRTTHAYLFSGPRGCGKTTSARILARALNCVEYPTATPCGKCASCIELARDRSGSLDVVEMDAASHGGVDNARELREQAGFAPVRDRYKIFIIDEAHMVTNQGFNALLKLVEEPPEHVKFIFATTEPEKVIDTIRSRTHHYPFRLVPPLELEKYLAQLTEAEGVTAGHDLLSLVVRAGTGSVRDTLSVLDQIIGGSEGDVLDYERAVALLGYTSATLLDDAVEAIAERDGAALFGVVDSVVKSGHDPRRFVEDLLQRLRDLVIISLAGDQAKDVFVSVPEDQYGRMVEQATKLGAQRASQSADLTSEALTDMAGATAPRLQLELLCARLVVARTEAAGVRPEEREPERPSPEVAENLAKYQKAQPRSSMGGGSSKRSESTVDPRSRPMPSIPQMSEPERASDSHSERPRERQAEGQLDPQAEHDAAPQVEQSEPSPDQQPESKVQQAPQQAAQPQVSTQTPDFQAPTSEEPVAAAPGDGPLDQIVENWDAIATDQGLSRIALAQLDAANGPVAVDDGVLIVGFDQPGVANAFTARGAREVAQLLSAKFGFNLRVEGRAGGEPAAPKAKAAQGAAPQPTAPTPVQHSAEQRTSSQDNIAQGSTPDQHLASTQQSEPTTNVGDGSAAQYVSGPPPAQMPTEPPLATPSSAPTASLSSLPNVSPQAIPAGDVIDEELSFAEPAREDEPYDHRSAMMEADACAVFPDSAPTAESGSFADSRLSHASGESPEPAPYSTSPSRASGPRPASRPSPQASPPPDLGPSVPSVESPDSDFEDFPMPPPMEDPFEHTVRGSWAPPEPDTDTAHTVVVDPDDEDDFVDDDNSEWEGASVDDPEISQSPVVGLQVVLERFDAKVIEERTEDS